VLQEIDELGQAQLAKKQSKQLRNDWQAETKLGPSKKIHKTKEHTREYMLYALAEWNTMCELQTFAGKAAKHWTK
jgi:hypothetical protein